MGVVLQEIAADFEHDLLHFVGYAGFDIVSASTETFGAAFVVIEIGAGKDDDREVGQAGRILDPLEDVEPIEAREFQINNEQIGQREVFAISIGRVALKVIKSLFAIVNEAKGVSNFLLRAGAAKHPDVVLVVFSNEDDMRLIPAV